mmetsp:Transcript_159115/g.305212  ORF Transcript_159115/g.305212 Transcript_159115/m.305212 type:complete len:200 (-) Transcript_159115:41-640(-)
MPSPLGAQTPCPFLGQRPCYPSCAPGACTQAGEARCLSSASPSPCRRCDRRQVGQLCRCTSGRASHLPVGCASRRLCGRMLPRLLKIGIGWWVPGAVPSFPVADCGRIAHPSRQRHSGPPHAKPGSTSGLNGGGRQDTSAVRSQFRRPSGSPCGRRPCASGRSCRLARCAGSPSSWSCRLLARRQQGVRSAEESFGGRK